MARFLLSVPSTFVVVFIRLVADKVRLVMRKCSFMAIFGEGRMEDPSSPMASLPYTRFRWLVDSWSILRWRKILKIGSKLFTYDAIRCDNYAFR